MPRKSLQRSSKKVSKLLRIHTFRCDEDEDEEQKSHNIFSLRQESKESGTSQEPPLDIETSSDLEDSDREMSVSNSSSQELSSEDSEQSESDTESNPEDVFDGNAGGS